MIDMDALLSRIEQARVLVGLFRAWDVSPEQLEILREVLASAERIATRSVQSEPTDAQVLAALDDVPSGGQRVHCCPD